MPGVKGGVSMVLVPKYGEKLWIPKSQKSHLLLLEYLEVYVYGSELVVLFLCLSLIFSLVEKVSSQIVKV